MRSHAWAAALIAIACATAIAPADAGAATAPASEVVTVDTTFGNDFDCPFPLQESITGAYKDTVYFDSAGNVTKEILTAQFGGPLTVTWTNPATGATLSSSESAPLIVYYNLDGSFASLQNTGLIFHVTVRARASCCSTFVA